MSSELIKLSGSNGSVIVGAETYVVPSGKLIFSAWVRTTCQITALCNAIDSGSGYTCKFNF